MKLVANCIGWAKRRRRKAAAKMHLRLDIHSFLSSFAVVDTAAHHDNRRAREVCEGISPGEVVVFDKAYVDFEHLHDLDQREVWWASRAEKNMACKVKKTVTKGVKGIVKDQLIGLKNLKHKGMLLRRVEAHVETEGEERRMVLITNSLSWSPSSVCDLYRRRWDVEVFFKQVKQTLRMSNLKAMGQHRGKSDTSGRFTMRGSNSGSLEWPHLKNDSLLQQGRSHGTASTLEKISPRKTCNRPHLNFDADFL